MNNIFQIGKDCTLCNSCVRKDESIELEGDLSINAPNMTVSRLMAAITVNNN